MKQKYVIIGESKSILFGEYFQHSEFSHMGKITSAGFCSIDKIKTDFVKYPSLTCCEMTEVYCYGESLSLNIKSNPELDQRLIQRLFND